MYINFQRKKTFGNSFNKYMSVLYFHIDINSSNFFKQIFQLGVILIVLKYLMLKRKSWDFPGDPLVKNLPANAGDTGSIPGPGRFHMPRSK